MFALVEIQ